MIVIEKAILHILDLSSGTTVYSDGLLPIEGMVETFLMKHIEKTAGSQEAKKGRFYEDSAFKSLFLSYLQEEVDFISFSKEITHILEDAFTHTEDMMSMDIIVCDAYIDDCRKLVVFKCNNHTGYVHQVSNTGAGIQNEIVHYYAMLPNLTQKMEEYVYVDAGTLDICFVGKRYVLDGNSTFVFPEVFLECEQAHSQKEAVKSITRAAMQVAEEFGQDQVAAAAAAKNCIAETMEQSEELDLRELGGQIFKENPAMRAEYESKVLEDGYHEPVQMNREATIKSVCKHKLKTDTGIELTIPTSYFDNTEYVEFYSDEDGSLSITLKHISNIINH